MDGSVGKEFANNVGDTVDVGSTCGLGRSPREGNGNPLQYFCLENSMDRKALQATVCRVIKESDTTEWLSTQSNKTSVSIEERRVTFGDRDTDSSKKKKKWSRTPGIKSRFQADVGKWQDGIRLHGTWKQKTTQRQRSGEQGGDLSKDHRSQLDGI